MVPVWAEARDFSVLYTNQTGCGFRISSYSVGNGIKTAVALSWPLSSIWCWVKQCIALYPHSATCPIIVAVGIILNLHLCLEPVRSSSAITKHVQNLLKRKKMHFGFMSVILLHSGNMSMVTSTCFGHSSGHLQGDKCKDTNISKVLRDHSQNKYGFNRRAIRTYCRCICILALTTLMMATRVAETCRGHFIIKLHS